MAKDGMLRFVAAAMEFCAVEAKITERRIRFRELRHKCRTSGEDCFNTPLEDTECEWCRERYAMLHDGSGLRSQRTLARSKMLRRFRKVPA